jgi:hypothetical protein
MPEYGVSWSFQQSWLRGAVPPQPEPLRSSSAWAGLPPEEKSW